MEFGTIITRVGEIIDVLGVIAIVVGVRVAATDAAVRRVRRMGPVYSRFRRVLVRKIDKEEAAKVLEEVEADDDQ